MDLLQKIDMFMLSEGKTTVSPYLRSVMDKQNAYSDADVKALIKKLDGDSVSIAISTPYTKGEKYVLVDDNDNVDTIAGKIASLGYKVTNKKSDGGKVYIYFK